MLLGQPSQIDQLTRPDHWHLDESDECFYFVEYRPGEKGPYSAGNQLILNFKKDVARYKHAPDRRPWNYKLAAIDDVSRAIATHTNATHLPALTFVPVPPSKAATDPHYDSRCEDALTGIRKFTRSAVDVRKLIVQTTSTRASHACSDRLGIDELRAIYRIEESLAAPQPQSLVVFDDVLTTGAHFKAAKAVLAARFPGIPIWGLFIARVIRPSAAEVFGFVDETRGAH